MNKPELLPNDNFNTLDIQPETQPPPHVNPEVATNNNDTSNVDDPAEPQYDDISNEADPAEPQKPRNDTGNEDNFVNRDNNPNSTETTTAGTAPTGELEKQKNSIFEKIGLIAITAEKKATEKVGEISREIAEKARQAVESIKKNSKSNFRKALSLFMAMSVMASISACNGEDDNTNKKANNLDAGTSATEFFPSEIPSEEALSKILDHETLEIGRPFDGDGNPGCYESKDKISSAALGNPNEILEKMGVDPAKATAEEVGKAIEFMLLSMKYPAGAEAIVYANAGIKGFDGFKGLTNVEAEDKIANMSDEEKKDLYEILKKTSEAAKYKITTFSAGTTVKNQGVFEDKDGVRHSNFIEVQLGEDVEIIEKTVTNEDGIEVTVCYKKDCGNIMVHVSIQFPNGQTVIFEIPQKEVKNSETASTSGEETVGKKEIANPKPKDQEKANNNSGASGGIVTPGVVNEDEITQEPVVGSGSGGSELGSEVETDREGTTVTGETTGEALSADESGNTIQHNLDNATGNTQANPAGDYSEEF